MFMVSNLKVLPPLISRRSNNTQDSGQPRAPFNSHHNPNISSSNPHHPSHKLQKLNKALGIYLNLVPLNSNITMNFRFHITIKMEISLVTASKIQLLNLSYSQCPHSLNPSHLSSILPMSLLLLSLRMFPMRPLVEKLIKLFPRLIKKLKVPIDQLMKSLENCLHFKSQTKSSPVQTLLQFLRRFRLCW